MNVISSRVVSCDASQTGQIIVDGVNNDKFFCIFRIGVISTPGCSSKRTVNVNKDDSSHKRRLGQDS